MTISKTYPEMDGVPDSDTFTENSIDEQHQQLRDRYHELAELAGSLAHEIKNPLSVIRMNMDLLAEDLADGESPGERRALSKVEIVQRQCARLENLLNDFLRFTRLQKLHLTPGSLNEQIERVLDLYEAQADEENIDIVRFLDPALSSIMMNPETLQAALVNLVKNAIEAMPGGGKLVARSHNIRGGVAMDLIDNGIGMDQKTALNMFEAFYSTKQGGSGLGLPTARKVIEAHGGRISVQSEVGVGTKFTLEFPTPARLAQIQKA